MRRLFAVLALSFVAVAPCEAQSFNCNELPGDGVILFSPSMPNSSQPVAISVGLGHYNPIGAVAAVQGNSINVVLNSTYNLFPVPRECVTTIVGPLPVGTYTVNLFAFLFTSPTMPTLVATNTLTVT